MGINVGDRFPVISGPSKFDLMLALFDRDNKDQRKVKFAIRRDGRKETYSLWVAEVRVGDEGENEEAGSNWFVRGYADPDARYLKKGENTDWEVLIDFSTVTRKGEMKFVNI